MKKLKLLLIAVALVLALLDTVALILAFSAYQKVEMLKYEGGTPPVDMVYHANSCPGANGKPVTDFYECGYWGRGMHRAGWHEAKAKCLKDSNEPCWTEETKALQQAFADKHQKPLEDIRLTVEDGDETHAKGLVGINGNGNSGVGGVYLAVKADGKWKIVFDGIDGRQRDCKDWEWGTGLPGFGGVCLGRGGFSCRDLEPYAFPASMVNDFCAD